MKTHRMNTASGFGSDACPLCGGVGYTVWRDDAGEVHASDCECRIREDNRHRIDRSGLSDLLEAYTFAAYRTPEEWQRRAKETAERYLTDSCGKWFFIGGTSGAGKTHLCTAICKAMMEGGIPVRYVQWRSDIPAIKAKVNNAEAYHDAVYQLKTIKALYIDDFLKGTPTEGDRNIAFDILNSRYIAKDLVTILSSELTIQRIIQWDPAMGGRIFERSKGYAINLEGKKNWRLQ